MIKAIITDVDGVIVGNKAGINFPLPNREIIQKLKDIHASGIPVVLCTSKFNYAIGGIIKQADLSGPHITDAGALIVDPLGAKILQKHVLDDTLTRDIVTASTRASIYTEVYEPTEYYVEAGQIGDLTEKRLKVLQKSHQSVNKLVEKLAELEVVKIIVFANDVPDKDRIEHVLAPFLPFVSFTWGMHPSHIPHQVGVITAKSASKRIATEEVLAQMGIGSDEALAIGDTAGDWSFMSICKYVATVGDASQELKESAQTKGKGNYYLAPGVDENGFLDILSFFRLN